MGSSKENEETIPETESGFGETSVTGVVRDGLYVSPRWIGHLRGWPLRRRHLDASLDFKSFLL
jgi:hypothetical protein